MLTLFYLGLSLNRTIILPQLYCLPKEQIEYLGLQRQIQQFIHNYQHNHRFNPLPSSLKILSGYEKPVQYYHMNVLYQPKDLQFIERLAPYNHPLYDIMNQLYNETSTRIQKEWYRDRYLDVVLQYSYSYDDNALKQY